MTKNIAAEIIVRVGFYDVDSMDVVWHGNYVKYLEDARCALLEKIGYGYLTMKEDGYAWPIVRLELKYMSPARFNQHIRITAELKEYENCLQIAYRISDAETGVKIAKAETLQMAVNMATGESLYASPKKLLKQVEAFLNA